MRWFGTCLLDRYGRVAILRLCGGLVARRPARRSPSPDPCGSRSSASSLWGAGAALGFPVGMSAAADDPVRAAARVSVVSTIGYSAFLAGPPLLGLLAQHVGYRHALLVIVVPVVLGLLVGERGGPAQAARASLIACRPS